MRVKIFERCLLFFRERRIFSFCKGLLIFIRRRKLKLSSTQRKRKFGVKLFKVTPKKKECGFFFIGVYDVREEFLEKPTSTVIFRNSNSPQHHDVKMVISKGDGTYFTANMGNDLFLFI